ncbi:hypothetical protein BH18ACT1_BH18ACT1_15340 [soil metagenome]
MRRWWRLPVRRRTASLADRLAQLERRVGDLEDSQFRGGDPGPELETMAARFDELAGRTVTGDEQLEARLEAARLAGEVARLTAQVSALAARDRSGLGDDPGWAASA